MNGAGLKSLYRHGYVATAREEDHRYMNAGEVHFPLQLQASHARHVDVQNHTTRAPRGWGGVAWLVSPFNSRQVMPGMLPSRPPPPASAPGLLFRNSVADVKACTGRPID